jgi:hypothetical protein
LAEGTHTVTILAEGTTAFLPDQDEPFDISRSTVSSTPTTVEFRVASSETKPESEGDPFPWLPVAAVSVVVSAVVAVSAVVYLKKRKR